MTCAFCPRCGYDLAENVPVIINDFSIFGPGHPLCYQGQVVKLTPCETELCWTLMRAFPNHVRRNTLLDRIDSDGGDEVLTTMVSKLRKKLTALGLPCPIATVRRVGYIWNV